MVTFNDIEAARTPKGGWTRAQLAEWGVPWPPPKGWKQQLIEKNSAPMFEAVTIIGQPVGKIKGLMIEHRPHPIEGIEMNTINIGEVSIIRWIEVHILGPQGILAFTVDEQEAQIIERNPYAWASQKFGVSEHDYLEWMNAGATARCGEMTKSGRLCRQAIGWNLRPKEWIEMDRSFACHVHQ